MASHQRQCDGICATVWRTSFEGSPTDTPEGQITTDGENIRNLDIRDYIPLFTARETHLVMLALSCAGKRIPLSLAMPVRLRSGENIFKSPRKCGSGMIGDVDILGFGKTGVDTG